MNRQINKPVFSFYLPYTCVAIFHNSSVLVFIHSFFKEKLIGPLLGIQ